MLSRACFGYCFVVTHKLLVKFGAFRYVQVYWATVLISFRYRVAD